VYTDLHELGDNLPDHAPRFVLLSYPLTLVSFYLAPGKCVPLGLIIYMGMGTCERLLTRYV
jgi:hypothetical protein